MIIFVKKHFKQLVLMLLIVSVFLFLPKDIFSYENIFSIIQNSPYSGIMFVMLFILGILITIPGAPLTIAAGLLFGFWKGTILVIIASNIASQIAFLIAKYLGRDFVLKYFGRYKLTNDVLTAIEKNAFMWVFYLRVIPIVPYSAVNYLIGLTKVSYKDYTIASFLGMLPVTIMYVYVANLSMNFQDNKIQLILSIILVIIFTIAVNFFKKRNFGLK